MSENVLLMDLDISRRRRPFPNLALMKLSAIHKAVGDEVYLNFPLRQPDRTYASCVFTWNAKRLNTVPADAVEGGSGINLTKELPQEIEHAMPDYDLYPGVDFSLGYTSRGCPRYCPWCIVRAKEGNIHATAPIMEFLDPRFKRVILLDNNFLASPSCWEVMGDLVKMGLEVDFNQGLDIRYVDGGMAWALSKLNFKQLRFAFDSLSYEAEVKKGIENLLARGIRSRRLCFYVLVGFGDDDSAIERMSILGSYNVDVFPMIYRGPDGKEPRLDKAIIPDTMWHGARGNLKKFLRVVGRLPGN